MTTSQDLLNLTVAAIIGPGSAAIPPAYATDCGAAVFSPGDWPTQDGQYPRSKARVLGEQKTSANGRNGPPSFFVTTTVRILIEVSQPAQVNDAGAVAAEQQLWRIARQHELAIIGSYPLTGLIMQFVSVNTQLTYTSEQATHLAGASIDIAMEFFQGPEMFAQIQADDMLGADETYPGFPRLASSFSLS